MTAAPKTEVRSLIETHKATLAALISEADQSEAGRLIARRAAALATWCDATEVLMAQGRDIDMGAYLRAVSTLQSLLTDATANRSVSPSYGAVLTGDPSNLELARRILFIHHNAKRDGREHLLPEPVLDLIAQVQPTPEATHETPNTRQ
ncbi:hypothetical protein [Mesorhizobium sp.]|uniref:hypothetical protein n=1 Tax=Mesorhizobium sp. TaxID=1871066 RepID=UPI000FE89761|nr:hypothetical protein [Mesorhizobium sp.]RWI80814.1 MAG: hypothetical protein EOR19_01985 [Mesorhizobium sp.]